MERLSPANQKAEAEEALLPCRACPSPSLLPLPKLPCPSTSHHFTTPQKNPLHKEQRGKTLLLTSPCPSTTLYIPGQSSFTEV